MYLSRDEEPDAGRLQALLKRAELDRSAVADSVRSILGRVKEEGDNALFALEAQFDHAELSSLGVSSEELDAAEKLVGGDLKKALLQASHNIRAFHEAQVPKGESLEVEPGVRLSRRIVPIHTVGLYIPGGTAPLFSTVLMLAIPAHVAGCPKIVLCTPPGPDGKVNPAILYAAKVGGVTDIFKIGGAQAIAAMAYGTESVPKVDKIFGPGNRFVMEAKLQASESCAIDMPAGPSEVMVIADTKSDPAFVASDLLSQAEHGPDSQAMLVLVSQGKEATEYLDQVEAAIARELSTLKRGKFLLSSLSHSHAIVMHDKEGAARIANAYAPEHLIINCQEYAKVLPLIESAGSIFLGPWSCESAGDYASGTNHTLPTSGWAHSFSGVSVDSFIKKLTVQELSKEGLTGLSKTIETMADGESLDAHKAAVTIRMGN